MKTVRSWVLGALLGCAGLGGVGCARLLPAAHEQAFHTDTKDVEPARVSTSNANLGLRSVSAAAPVRQRRLVQRRRPVARLISRTVARNADLALSQRVENGSAFNSRLLHTNGTANRTLRRVLSTVQY